MRSMSAPLKTGVDPPHWSHGRFIGLRDDPAALALMVSGWFLWALATWQLGRIVAELGLEDMVFDPLADSEIGRWLTVALLGLVAAFSYQWARNRQESVGARPEHLSHSQHRPPDGRDRAPEVGLSKLPWAVTGGINGGCIAVTFQIMLNDIGFEQTERAPIVWILVLSLILTIAGVMALGSLWARRRIASKLPADHGTEFANDLAAAFAHGFAVVSALTAVWVAGRTGVPANTGIGSTLRQMRLNLLWMILPAAGALFAAIFRLRLVARRQAMAAASAPAPSASAAS